MTFKQLGIKLKRLVDNVVDNELLNEIGKRTTKQVKDRTRKGFGVEEQLGPKTRLKPLTTKYKKRRAKLRKRGKLSSETSPNKSNLTKSGEMLDSTDYTISRDTVTVAPKGRRNKEKASAQEKAGRTAYNISKSENKELLKFIENEITKDIKKQGL